MSPEFYDAAVFGDLPKLRRQLTEDPALIRSTDQWGFTALHGVAGEDHLEVASFLMDRGADPNAKNDEGITPLHLAANPEMVELLIRRGAVVDSRSNDGRTPLLVQVAEAEGLEVIEALLRLGADPNAMDDAGNTALTIARDRKDPEKVALFERHGSPGKKPRWKFW